MHSLLRVLEFKESLRSKVENIIGDDKAGKVHRDPHAKRKPIGCGLTIHPGIGCTYQCSYCYLNDMGISTSHIEPYTLSGVELVYALLSNPYFVPTVYGTFLPFGSITEPFHPKIKSKTLEFMRNVRYWLKNPIQFSTKAYIDYELALKIREACNGLVSPLITIITLKHYKLLEPHAPPPTLRLESIANLRRVGLKPQVFIRPIIPGINDDEVVNIVSTSIEYGACSAVIGGFRASKNILSKLEKLGFNMSRIVDRVTIGKGVFYEVKTRDIRRDIIEKMPKKITCHITACCACAFVHKVPCWGLDWIKGTCMSCPLQCWNRVVEITADDVMEVLEYFNVKGISDVKVSKTKITLKATRRKIKEHIVIILETLTRRKVIIIR